MDREIIIVGAGPTGLVLALWLARLGIPLRIVDKAAGPGTTSRAVAMQDIPREQPGTERAAESNQHRHADAHRVPAWKQQTSQRTHEETHEEQNDEIDDETHTRILAGTSADGQGAVTSELSYSARARVARVRAHRRLAPRP